MTCQEFDHMSISICHVKGIPFFTVIVYLTTTSSMYRCFLKSLFLSDFVLQKVQYLQILKNELVFMT